MNTAEIEERAEQFAKMNALCFECNNGNTKFCPCAKYKMHKMVYEGIANNQRKIDIQKAIDATCDLCMANMVCRREVNQKECKSIMYIKDSMKGE